MNSAYSKHAYNNIRITDHASKRIRERLDMEATRDLVGEVWERQLGPDQSWNVPRIRQRGKKLRYLSRGNFVFVFEVVDRGLAQRRALAKLVTVVGPLSAESPWNSSYEEEGH